MNNRRVLFKREMFGFENHCDLTSCFGAKVCMNPLGRVTTAEVDDFVCVPAVLLSTCLFVTGGNFTDTTTAGVIFVPLGPFDLTESVNTARTDRGENSEKKIIVWVIGHVNYYRSEMSAATRRNRTKRIVVWQRAWPANDRAIHSRISAPTTCRGRQ